MRYSRNYASDARVLVAQLERLVGRLEYITSLYLRNESIVYDIEHGVPTAEVAQKYSLSHTGVYNAYRRYTGRHLPFGRGRPSKRISLEELLQGLKYTVEPFTEEDGEWHGLAMIVIE